MSAPWTASILILWAVVITQSFLILGVLRRSSNVIEQAEKLLREGLVAGPWVAGGVDVGEAIPPFRAYLLDGSQVSHDDLMGVASIVLFLSGGCGPCRALASALPEHQPDELRDVRLFFVVDSVEDVEVLQLGSIGTVLLQDNKELALAFRTNATPHAFAVSDNGAIAAVGHPNTSEALFDLIRTVSRGGVNGVAVSAGQRRIADSQRRSNVRVR